METIDTSHATASPTPQQVLAPPAKSAIFLVLTIDPGGEQDVGDLLGDVSGLVRSVGFRLPEGELSCVVGIGFHAWSRLFTGPRPAQLHPFREMQGERHTAPSTPGDLLLHLRSSRMDLCFELATQLMARLRGHATVVDETHGFRSFDERDMLGFVDGTESPDGAAAVTAALIGPQDEAWCGGSYVIVQKYVHQMQQWDALTVEEQELAIGRHKTNNIELADTAKPANSHLALNVIEDDDGNELQIVRDNMPFGEVGSNTFGTYFIGYAADPRVTERMLSNMFIGDPPGTHDRILDFSTAVTGGLFFVPDADFLDDPPLLR